MIEAVITGVELALPGEHARGERLPRVLEPDSDMEGAGSVETWTGHCSVT